MTMLKRWASRLGMRLLQWATDDPVHLPGVELVRQLRNIDDTHKALRSQHAAEFDRRNLGPTIQGWRSDRATKGDAS